MFNMYLWSDKLWNVPGTSKTDCMNVQFSQGDVLNGQLPCSASLRLRAETLILAKQCAFVFHWSKTDFTHMPASCLSVLLACREISNPTLFAPYQRCVLFGFRRWMSYFERQTWSKPGFSLVTAVCTYQVCLPKSKWKWDVSAFSALW